MKIYCVIGARPQFIKAAALMRATLKFEVNLSLVHTGQHFDEAMSQIFFDEMEIPQPIHQLCCGGLTQGAMTGRMMEGLEKIFIEEKPDFVIVFGDTNSTLAAALTASKLHIPLAHIEAGLRSHNKRMAEEINRVVTDHCSDYLFTPVESATENLIKEGIEPKKIYTVGDIMVDTYHYYQEKALRQTPSVLSRLNLTPKEYILATVHRGETIKCQKTLASVFNALMKISKECPILLPLHPATLKALLESNSLNHVQENLKIIDPQGYFDILVLQQHAKMILTDSGGMQKEAYLAKVPCITLRNETEWNELVDLGYNFLSSTDEEAIYNCYIKARSPISKWDEEIYGNGQTSEKIFSILRG